MKKQFEIPQIIEGLHGYKVFREDWSCRGFKYEVGKTYEIKEKISCCKIGYHFCINVSDCFKFYDFNVKNKVAEVVALGDVIIDGYKCCTNKIKILKEIPWSKVVKMVNIGHACTGIENTWNYNSGRKNTGSYNSGNFNTGDYNIGSMNTGEYNIGNSNVGDYNSGSCNVGDWNISSFNIGCFNTDYLNTKIMMFNKESDWDYLKWLKCDARSILLDCPVLSKDVQSWWDGLPIHDKNEVLSLPNFDKDIFFQCTGIRV